jgi:hypothetical protein
MKPSMLIESQLVYASICLVNELEALQHIDSPLGISQFIDSVIRQYHFNNLSPRS